MTTDLAALAERIHELSATESARADEACILRLELPSLGWVGRSASGGVWREGPRATATHPFRIASITKPFTGVVITQLAAEGRLSFDDPIEMHLPPEQRDIIPRLHVIDGVSYGSRITVRHCLTHASGLFDYAQSEGFFGTIALDPGRPWTPREMLEGSIEWGSPHFAPGEGYGYAYSDTGYVLLGLAIEHLDGRSLHEAYRARILEPLGMTATYLEGHEAHRGPELVHAHQGDFDVAPIHGTADWSGGGLVSDVDDLAVFAAAILDGRLVDEPWRSEMLRWDFRRLDPALHTPGYLGYAFGVDVRESNGFVLRGHRGHWGALMHRDPLTGLTITGTISQAAIRPDHVMHGLTAAVREFVDPADLGGVA